MVLTFFMMSEVQWMAVENVVFFSKQVIKKNNDLWAVFKHSKVLFSKFHAGWKFIIGLLASLLEQPIKFVLILVRQRNSIFEPSLVALFDVSKGCP